MTQTVTVEVEKPIVSVEILEKPGKEPSGMSIEPERSELLKQQTEGLEHVRQALEDAVKKINEYQEQIFNQHKDEIVRLSVAIARKILVQKVQDKDYKIESIVKEALNKAPSLQDVVVHLNPDDLAASPKALKDALCEGSGDIKFVPDSNIGPAECLLETPKGIIGAYIDGQIERIGEELKKVK